jgi:excisionase family DNA binding protein
MAPHTSSSAITLYEAAKRLNLAYETVRRKANCGAIPAFKLGGVGQWRIFEDDLLDYARGQYAAQERKPEPESS